MAERLLVAVDPISLALDWVRAKEMRSYRLPQITIAVQHTVTKQIFPKENQSTFTPKAMERKTHMSSFLVFPSQK